MFGFRTGSVFGVGLVIRKTICKSGAPTWAEGTSMAAVSEFILTLSTDVHPCRLTSTYDGLNEVSDEVEQSALQAGFSAVTGPPAGVL